MNTYKLRAECFLDVQNLFKKFSPVKFKIERPGPIADCTFEFDSYLDLGTLKHLIKSIPDGHVMFETIETLERYTGERK